MLDQFNLDPDRPFMEPFDIEKFERLKSEGYSEKEAFSICSFNENALMHYKDYKLFFLSYRHNDRDQYPIISQTLFLLKQWWPGFLDSFDIPFDRTSEWEDYVEKAISHSTLVLLFWSIEASKSKAIKKEIEIALAKKSYLIVLLFDDTSTEIFPENTIFLRNKIPYNIATKGAEDLGLACLFIRTLFEPNLERRISVDGMLKLSAHPSITRVAARNISRYGNWEISPSFISQFADFMIDMPSLKSSDGSIPLSVTDLLKFRETPEYKKYLNAVESKSIFNKILSYIKDIFN